MNQPQRLDPNRECAKGNHLASSWIAPETWKCVWCGVVWKQPEAPRADAV